MVRVTFAVGVSLYLWVIFATVERTDLARFFYDGDDRVDDGFTPLNLHCVWFIVLWISFLRIYISSIFVVPFFTNTGGERCDTMHDTDE